MNNKRSILHAFFLVVGLSAVFSLIPTASGFNSSGSINRTRSTHPYASFYQPILEEFTRKGHPGVGALIRTQEEGTWNGVAGYAKIEDQTYTAAAILMLWEEGLIELDACIDTYLPSDISDRIPNGHTATIRQLLAHTSGIPDSDEERPFVEIINDPLSWKWEYDLEGIYDMPALFPAGTNLEYRSSNYILLAVILDRLTGSHEQFFSKQIFQIG